MITNSTDNIYLSDLLDEDEQILWRGQPSEKVARKYTRILALFGLTIPILVLIAFIGIPAFISRPAMTPVDYDIISIFQFLFIFFSITLIVPVIYLSWLLIPINNSNYFLTNKRVIIHQLNYYSRYSNPSSQFTCIFIPNLDRININPWRGGNTPYSQVEFYSKKIARVNYYGGSKNEKKHDKEEAKFICTENWGEFLKIFEKNNPELKEIIFINVEHSNHF